MPPAGIPPDPGILTAVLQEFITVFAQGYGRIYPDVQALFIKLLTFDFILWGLAMLCVRDMTTMMEGLIWKLLKIGAFVFIFTNYSWLASLVIESFIALGLKAGGSTMTVAEFTNPSALAQLGFVATEPIWGHISRYGVVGAMVNLWDVLLSESAGFLIIGAFFGMAILVFITFIEFYMMGVIGLILLPFAAWGVTAHWAERVFGYVISFGLRCCTLAFIASAAFPILIRLNLGKNPDPQLNPMLSLLLGAGGICFLAWHFTSIVGGIPLASPQTSSSMIASSTNSLALAAGSLARLASTAGREAVSSVRAGAALGRRLP